MTSGEPAGIERRSVALDSSVIVAALSPWHERHTECHPVVAGALVSGDDVVVSGHTLIEVLAVLTRLPSPYRISPSDAEELLRRAFEGRATTVGDDPRGTWSLLRRAAAGGVAVGAVYDLRIALAASEGGATEILTLNARDFDRFGFAGVAIVAI